MLSTDQIRVLAECEGLMDEGKMAYVMLAGQRVSVSAAAMAEFGLSQGQTINDQIFVAILEFNVSDLTAQIAIKKAQDAAAAARKE